MLRTFVQWQTGLVTSWWDLWRLEKPRELITKEFWESPTPTMWLERCCQQGFPPRSSWPQYWIKRPRPLSWPTVSLFSPHPRGASWPAQRILTYSVWTSGTTSRKEYSEHSAEPAPASDAELKTTEWTRGGCLDYDVTYENKTDENPFIAAFIFSPMLA